jgi:hypothetical protein
VKGTKAAAWPFIRIDTILPVAPPPNTIGEGIWLQSARTTE